MRSPVDQCPGYVNDCADHTTRTIWDGDQVLWEIRTNGSTEDDNAYGNNAGRVGYTHAGLDAPLSMYRINYTNGSAHTLIVHMNWRGLPDDATFPGSTTDTISGALHISSIPFPAKSYDAYFRKPIDTAPTQWFGSIISGSRDASGQFYRRNRFYDANSGQFTQEDPAGLAGGLNAYGFGGGDPVTYSDPYGLMSCPPMCDEMNPRHLDLEVQTSHYAAQHPRGALALSVIGVLSAVAGFGIVAAAPTVPELAMGGSPLLAESGGSSAIAAQIAEAAQGGGGNALAQIQRAGHLIGRLGLSQGGAMTLLKTTLDKLGFEYGEDVDIGGVQYLLSANSSKTGTIHAVGVTDAGEVINAVLREVRGGFEIVH